jgi:hypothetical protein
MAVRTILSTLNGLTQAGLLAGAWLRRAAGPARSGSSARPEGLREPREQPYAQGGVEPPLEEVLRDPLVQSVMRADQWEPAEVRRLLKSKQKPLVA